MQLNSNNRSIAYKGEDIVSVLNEISFILCSLHNIGSCYADCIDENDMSTKRKPPILLTIPTYVIDLQIYEVNSPKVLT